MGVGCGLLEVGGCRILLDVGWAPPFDVEALDEALAPLAPTIDAVLLSSASVGACGALPRLVRRLALPPHARVFATPPVHRLGRLSLYDVATAVAGRRPDFDGFTLDDVDGAFALAGGAEGEGGRFVAVRYLEEVALPSAVAPRRRVVTATAAAAGGTLGAAVWRITSGAESVLYAPAFHHRSERHLPPAHLPPDFVHKPTLVVTHAGAFVAHPAFAPSSPLVLRPSQVAAAGLPGLGGLLPPTPSAQGGASATAATALGDPAHRKDAVDEALAAAIVANLRGFGGAGGASAYAAAVAAAAPHVAFRRPGAPFAATGAVPMSGGDGGGSVLIPTDTCGRALELLLRLDRRWSPELPPLVYCNIVASTALEFGKTSLEYMAPKLTRTFADLRTTPLQYEHVRIARTHGELDAIIAVARSALMARTGNMSIPLGVAPICVVASFGDLEHGFSRDLMLRWAADPRTLVVLTDPAALVPGSLVEQLARGSLAAAEEAVGGAAGGDGDGGGAAAPPAAPQALSLTQYSAVPLSGEEAKEHEAAVARRRERAAAEAAEAAATAAAESARALEDEGYDEGGRGSVETAGKVSTSMRPAAAHAHVGVV